MTIEIIKYKPTHFKTEPDNKDLLRQYEEIIQRCDELEADPLSHEYQQAIKDLQTVKAQAHKYYRGEGFDRGC